MHGSEGKKRISSVAVKIVKLSVKFKRCSYQQIIQYIYLYVYIYISLYIYIYQDCNRKRRIVTRSLRLPFVLICMRKIKSRFSLFYLLFRPGDSKHWEIHSGLLFETRTVRCHGKSIETSGTLPPIISPPFLSFNFTQSSRFPSMDITFAKWEYTSKIMEGSPSFARRRFTRVYINSRIN